MGKTNFRLVATMSSGMPRTAAPDQKINGSSPGRATTIVSGIPKVERMGKQINGIGN